MTDEAMTAVERAQDQLAYADKMQAREAALDRDDLRTLLTLARQSVGVEEIGDEIEQRDLGGFGEWDSGYASGLKEAAAIVRSRLTRSVRTADLTEKPA